MTAAWLFVRLRSSDRRWLPWVCVAAQVAAAAFVVWSMRTAGIHDLTATAGTYDHWTATLPLALAFAVLVLATVLAPRWAQSPVANPASRALGDVSYGVYLWHTIVIGFALVTLGLSSNGTTGAFLALLAVTLAASLGLATLSLLFVERPCIRWARRCSRRIERHDGRRPRADEPEAVEAVTPANAW
jgi:peptidoglycan/LPS O-acetylase OafA/YrhL